MAVIRVRGPQLLFFTLDIPARHTTLQGRYMRNCVYMMRRLTAYFAGGRVYESMVIENK